MFLEGGLQLVIAFEYLRCSGFYLHNQLVFAVFNTHPRLYPYLIAGYGESYRPCYMSPQHRTPHLPPTTKASH